LERTAPAPTTVNGPAPYEHVIPDAERVVASRRGWAMVEKRVGPGGDVAVRADPPAACSS
jgi:hypothetical protein